MVVALLWTWTSPKTSESRGGHLAGSIKPYLLIGLEAGYNRISSLCVRHCLTGLHEGSLFLRARDFASPEVRGTFFSGVKSLPSFPDIIVESSSQLVLFSL